MSAVAAKRATGTAPGAAVPPSRSPTSSVPPVPLEHEELVVRRGTRSGRYVIVAIHSTALGPALGGVRLWHYPATTDGIRDALRLARGMTSRPPPRGSTSAAARA